MLYSFLSKVFLRDFVLLYQLVEVLLSMRTSLCTCSRPDIFVHLIPVLTVKPQSLYKPIVLIVRPAPVYVSRGVVLAGVVPLRLLFMAIFIE